MSSRAWWVGGISLGGYGLLYVPLLAVVVFSFNTSRHGVVWKGFTLEWYAAAARDPAALRALVNTIALAVVSTGIATVIGGSFGYGLARLSSRARQRLRWVLDLPMYLPDIALAVALLMWCSIIQTRLSWLGLGWPAMICGHVTFQIPFVALVVQARLLGLDPVWEEAAQDLGANSWQTFRFVTWPLMRPGVLAGSLLAFTLSLDDFVVSFFTSGPGSTTLPVLIYSSVKRGVTPEMNALSSVIVVASIVVTLLMTRGRRTVVMPGRLEAEAQKVEP